MSSPRRSVWVANCAVATAEGRLVLNGTIEPNLLTATVDVTGELRDAATSAVVARYTANLDAVVSPRQGGACTVTGAALGLQGTWRSEIPGVVTVTLAFPRSRKPQSRIPPQR